MINILKYKTVPIIIKKINIITTKSLCNYICRDRTKTDTIPK